jgi:hypothetical protein
MPRRLVYIDHQRQSWKLVETNGRQEPYIALSYVWGSGESCPRLTESTLNTFRNGVAVTQMPKTFRDAWIVCESLMVKYLWVDALCILSDNDDDTISEVLCMADTYRSAGLIMSPLDRKRQCYQREVPWRRYSLLCAEDTVSDQVLRFIEQEKSADILSIGFGSESSSGMVSSVQDDSSESSLSQDGDSTSVPSTDTPPATTEPVTSALNPCKLAVKDESATPEGDTGCAQEVAQRVDTAWLRVQEGLKHYERKSVIPAIAEFWQARDIITQDIITTHEELIAHLQATIYLTRILLKNDSAQAALDALCTSEALVAGVANHGDSLKAT